MNEVRTKRMKPKNIYAVLALAGAIVPLWQFAPFVRDHGLDVRLLLTQLFATPVSSFFAWDVIVTSFVLWALVYFEGRRAGMTRLWLPVLASLLVGVSLGLPLFLYMREAALDETGRTRTAA
jgi:hypothetical protein